MELRLFWRRRVGALFCAHLVLNNLICSALGAQAQLLGSSHLRGTGGDVQPLLGLHTSEVFTYDYTKHGQDWAMGTCASRTRQSPIDLPATLLTNDVNAAGARGADVMDAPVTFGYRYSAIELPFELQNTGRMYSADLSAMGYGGVAYDDAWYDLKSAHLHVLSEHTWGGRREPGELQLVHQRYDGDEVLIVAFALDDSMQASPAPAPAATTHLSLLDDGASAPAPAQILVASGGDSAGYTAPPEAEPNFNPVVQAFLRVALPPPAVSINVPALAPLNFSALFDAGAFLEYEGSMTSPPCSETVTWLVRKDPMPASATQLKYLATGVAAMTAGEGNYREVMPLNGRVVGVRHAIFSEHLLPANLPPALPVDGPMTVTAAPHLSTGVAQVAQQAREALRVASNASAYARTLGWHLAEARRSAAAKHLLHDSSASADVAALRHAVSSVASGVAQQVVAAANISAQAAAKSAVSTSMERLRALPSSP